MSYFTQAPGTIVSFPTYAIPSACQYKNTGGNKGLGMTQARLAKQAIHNWRQGKLWMPSRSEIQQYPNVQQLVALLSFISSFLFLSVSCLLFSCVTSLTITATEFGGAGGAT